MYIHRPTNVAEERVLHGRSTDKRSQCTTPGRLRSLENEWGRSSHTRTGKLANCTAISSLQELVWQSGNGFDLFLNLVRWISHVDRLHSDTQAEEGYTTLVDRSTKGMLYMPTLELHYSC